MVAAEEARSILSHLLSKLEEPEARFSSRYREWVQKHGKAELEKAIFACLRTEVLTYLQLGNGNVNSMKNIGGDLNWEGRAVYLHGVLGLDRRTRVYIGQSTGLRTRLKQHWNHRYRRDNASLHYHAVQNSTFDVFAVLAIIPTSSRFGYHDLVGMDQPDLYLNVLEMWCCLLFRSLPPQILAEYLPDEALSGQKKTVSVGLNIANPLDHGGKEAFDWVDLSESDDPLVLEYVHGTDGNRTQSLEEVEKRRHQAVEEVEKLRAELVQTRDQAVEEIERRRIQLDQARLQAIEEIEGIRTAALEEIEQRRLEAFVREHKHGGFDASSVPLRTVLLISTAVVVGFAYWKRVSVAR